jgi:cell division protein FtsW
MNRKSIPEFHGAKPILLITFVLVTVGLIMVYSTSAIFAQDKLGDQYYFVSRQFAWAGLGMIAMAIASFVPLEHLKRFSKPFVILTIFILAVVLFPQIGVKVGGARRWLRFGRWNFQPAEMAKLALIMYSAHFLSKPERNGFFSGSRKQELFSNFRRTVLPLLVVLGIVVALILLQPDLGTAIIIGTIVLVLMFVGGIDLKHLAILGAAALPVLALLIFKVGYRWQRMLVFLKPWEDPAGRGWQITQSFIALGSGGFAGRGLGQSVQKLYYLPESFTDFIFSIIGEELGFVGTSVILLLFAAFVCQGIRISRNASGSFAYLLGDRLSSHQGTAAPVCKLRRVLACCEYDWRRAPCEHLTPRKEIR